MNLEVRHLRQEFDGVRALDDACLGIDNDHASLVLIGPSGGGKSTLLRVLGGLQVPRSGRVLWDGKPMRFDQDSLLRWRRRNGFVFQQFNLFPHLTAADNIVLPLTKVHGLTNHEAGLRAQAWLDRFGVGNLAGRRPGAMSGGQQQRVALARAMAHEPRRLFLDEPTSALDPAMTVEVLEAVFALAAEGQQIIVATHEMGFARALDSTVAMLAAGRVVECAPAARLFIRPAGGEARAFLRHLGRFDVNAGPPPVVDPRRPSEPAQADGD